MASFARMVKELCISTLAFPKIDITDFWMYMYRRDHHLEGHSGEVRRRGHVETAASKR